MVLVDRTLGGQAFPFGLLPRSYQVTPLLLGGGGRHNERWSDPKADKQTKSQPATRPGPNPASRTAAANGSFCQLSARQAGRCGRNQHPVPGASSRSPTRWQKAQTTGQTLFQQAADMLRRKRYSRRA